MGTQEKSKSIIEIGGLSFVVNQCLKMPSFVKQKSIFSKAPLVNAQKLIINNEESYRVSITAFIPNNLNNVPVVSASMIPLSNEKGIENKLYLKYNGVSVLKTDSTVDENLNNKSLKEVTCRNLQVVYDASSTGLYHLYYIVLDYKILSEYQLITEAVVVSDFNEDPETSRGTITTSSSPG